MDISRNASKNRGMQPITRPVHLSKKREAKVKNRFTKRLARRIKRLRKSKKMSQEQLAFEAGLNPAYISHLERGVYSPSAFICWKIAQAFKISLTKLVEGI
jgi:DNA-binding XRE family transcriptional regulator